MESPISVETFIKSWNEVGKSEDSQKFLEDYGVENEYPELMCILAMHILQSKEICHHFTMGFLFCLYCVEQEKVNKELKELERISNGR